MGSVSRHSGIDVIESNECQKLLAQDTIGRIAVVIGATPMIFPVNYIMDGDALIIRTMPGSRLDVGQGLAAFEVDSFDRVRQSGWSVLATGRLEEVLGRERNHSSPVVWPAGERSLCLRLRPSSMTGRVVGGDETGGPS